MSKLVNDLGVEVEINVPSLGYSDTRKWLELNGFKDESERRRVKANEASRISKAKSRGSVSVDPKLKLQEKIDRLEESIRASQDLLESYRKELANS